MEHSKRLGAMDTPTVGVKKEKGLKEESRNAVIDLTNDDSSLDSPYGRGPPHPPAPMFNLLPGYTLDVSVGPGPDGWSKMTFSCRLSNESPCAQVAMGTKRTDPPQEESKPKKKMRGEDEKDDFPAGHVPATPQVPFGVPAKGQTVRPRTAISAAVRARTQSIPGVETMIEPEEDTGDGEGEGGFDPFNKDNRGRVVRDMLIRKKGSCSRGAGAQCSSGSTMRYMSSRPCSPRNTENHVISPRAAQSNQTPAATRQAWQTSLARVNQVSSRKVDTAGDDDTSGEPTHTPNLSGLSSRKGKSKPRSGLRAAGGSKQEREKFHAEILKQVKQWLLSNPDAKRYRIFCKQNRGVITEFKNVLRKKYASCYSEDLVDELLATKFSGQRRRWASSLDVASDESGGTPSPKQ